MKWQISTMYTEVLIQDYQLLVLQKGEIRHVPVLSAILYVHFTNSGEGKLTSCRGLGIHVLPTLKINPCTCTSSIIYVLCLWLMHYSTEYTLKQYCFLSPSFETGGSWQKSPQSTSCIPPKGIRFLLTDLATASSLSKNSASIIEISSITRQQHLLHMTAWDSREAREMQCSSVPFPVPIPANACRVVPPISEAAAPVLAVANVVSGGRELMILLRR